MLRDDGHKPHLAQRLLGARRAQAANGTAAVGAAEHPETPAGGFAGPARTYAGESAALQLLPPAELMQLIEETRLALSRMDAALRSKQADALVGRLFSRVSLVINRYVRYSLFIL